mgnify:CR=1 FL=1
MSQLPERYQAAIAPLIDKAREFLEKGEELAPMAFFGNFSTRATIPAPLSMNSPAEKDAVARSLKLFAEQLKEWARPLLRMLTRGRRVTPRASRNAPCPCGSGQKYKKCCWATDTAATVAAIPR